MNIGFAKWYKFSELYFIWIFLPNIKHTQYIPEDQKKEKDLVYQQWKGEKMIVTCCPRIGVIDTEWLKITPKKRKIN